MMRNGLPLRRNWPSHTAKLPGADCCSDALEEESARQTKRKNHSHLECMASILPVGTRSAKVRSASTTAVRLMSAISLIGFGRDHNRRFTSPTAGTQVTCEARAVCPTIRAWLTYCRLRTRYRVARDRMWTSGLRICSFYVW